MLVGLSSEEAAFALAKYGINEIPEKGDDLIRKIIKSILSPMSLMLLLASALSYGLGKLFDAYFICFLLLLNISITLWQENKADRAIRKLNESLDEQIETLRDGKWMRMSSRSLVPGDIIRLGAGGAFPADGTVIEATSLEVNESALTGESLPKDKQTGDSVLSGTFVSTGIAVVEVSSTGERTKFGKTLFSVERVRKQSMLEKDIIGISKFLSGLSFSAVILLSAVLIFRRLPILELLTLDLSLIIASIPVSLPTVMTLIIEFGVLELAKKKVIVRRLSALEDLANVNFLLTDKTGTLTQNKISVQDIYSCGGFAAHEVAAYAAAVSSCENENPIDSAISEKARQMHVAPIPVRNMSFIPADSVRKRSTLTGARQGKGVVITMGAPQVVADLCRFSPAEKDKFNREVGRLARQGYRALAVAVSEGAREEQMQPAGLLALSDVLRTDARSVTGYLRENGIGVAMVTGDSRAIASQIAGELDLGGGRVVTKEELDRMAWKPVREDFFLKTGAFAEILPEDKFRLVEKAKEFFTVASNGDGVNDLPAVKAANVGIAVSSAVAVLKAAADIVFTTDGIAVMKDAIIESRKIFERLYTYSLYRISESLRLIVTITLLGIGYGTYPLTALQIILITLLNDIPIISLAFDRVEIAKRPAKVNVRERFTLSSFYGLAGVANSLILFYLLISVLHTGWGVVQTLYFLKVTVSGHMLIYVAHTKERWWKFLPSRRVIWATTLTQLIASLMAVTGFLMPARLSVWQVLFVWIWSAGWMQVSELTKILQQKAISRRHAARAKDAIIMNP